jgi:hypothetical protein
LKQKNGAANAMREAAKPVNTGKGGYPDEGKAEEMGELPGQPVLIQDARR